MVTGSRPGHSITRNISFYKKIQLQQRKGQWQDWDNMEEDISDVSDNIDDERSSRTGHLMYHRLLSQAYSQR